MAEAAAWIAAAFGAWLVGVSLFALARPRRAIALIGAFASTSLINAVELCLRALAGAAFIIVAAQTPYPRAFAVIGWMLVISAAALMLVSRKRHAAFAAFWARRLPVAAAIPAVLVSLAAGLFLLATIAPLLLP